MYKTVTSYHQQDRQAAMIQNKQQLLVINKLFSP